MGLNMSDNTIITLTFVFYLLLVMIIGIIAYRQTASFSDYVLGGRRIGAWVAAISAGASDMSGWLLLGLPGYAYSSGLQAIWLVAGLWTGTYLNWRLVARRIRVFSELAGNSLTLPEFLNHRFVDTKNHIRLIAAITTIVFFTLYTVSGLVASGKLFNSVFSISYEWAVLIGVIAIVLYTFIGGFLAVSWTDLFQGLLMLMALMIVPVLTFVELGGWQAIADSFSTSNPAMLNLFGKGAESELSILAILSLLAWGLGYFGQPHILARFKAVSHTNQIPRARRIAVSWSALSMIFAMLVGLFGYSYLNPAQPLSDPERVFIEMVSQVLPPVVAGVCLAAILAAIMSTADSQLLVSASVLTEDVYRVLAKKQISEQRLVWTGRWVVVAIAIVATALAWNPDNRVLSLVAYAWAGFGAAFGPLLLFGLFWRGVSKAGALAGMISGALTVIIWKQLEGGVFELYELLPGFIISSLCIVIVSRWISRPSPSVVEQFDNYIMFIKDSE